MTPAIPAAARRAAEAMFREWNTCDVEQVIARECHLTETVDVLRRIIREPTSLADGGTDSNGNWVVRLTPAEMRFVRDLLAKLEAP